MKKNQKDIWPKILIKILNFGNANIYINIIIIVIIPFKQKYIPQWGPIIKIGFPSLSENINNVFPTNLYINFEDLFKGLQLQNKIINILKIYITNKIEEK